MIFVWTIKIGVIFLWLADNVENIVVDVPGRTNHCIGDVAKQVITSQNLVPFDYNENQSKYVVQEPYKCCIDSGKLCLFYDPCITRNLKLKNDQTETVYLAFLGGKYTNSDFSIAYNSKTNKNQKLNPRVYNFSVSFSSDSNGLLWIQVTTENCDSSKLPQSLQCNKRYISAIYHTHIDSAHCTFLERLHKSGSTRFFITFIVAPIATCIMIVAYMIFNKKVLLKEYKMVEHNQPPNNDAPPTVDVAISNTTLNVSKNNPDASTLANTTKENTPDDRSIELEVQT